MEAIAVVSIVERAEGIAVVKEGSAWRIAKNVSASRLRYDLIVCSIPD